MEDILTTAMESTALEDIEAIEPIEASDLTLSNLKAFLTGLLPDLKQLAFNIVISVIIFVIGRQILKILHRLMNRALERGNADPGFVKFMDSALSILFNVFLAFIIIGQLGFNTASIVTILGASLLAVGMSLQGSLANVAGGILLILARPFRVGHYIESEYGDGTVTMIGLVYTTITTKDNRVLTIPNSQISNCAVTDCNANPVRRLDLQVGISYDSDIRRAKEILQKICEDSPHVLKDPPTSIFVDSLGESAVHLGLYCYVASSDFLGSKWDLTEAIKLRFDEGGIKIPFPQVQVHMGQK